MLIFNAGKSLLQHLTLKSDTFLLDRTINFKGLLRQVSAWFGRRRKLTTGYRPKKSGVCYRRPVLMAELAMIVLSRLQCPFFQVCPRISV